MCVQWYSTDSLFLPASSRRLHNKGVYVRVGLRRMVSRKSWKDLQKEIRIEVDGKVVNLPAVEGIIILNILR